MSAAISADLGFQIFSFIVGIPADALQEGKSFANDRDRDLSQLEALRTRAPNSTIFLALSRAIGQTRGRVRLTIRSSILLLIR
jgi:hypothetical protein